MVDSIDNGTAITRQGYDEIKRELQEILTVKRPAIANRLKEAIALGDLSENFDYHDAKRQQGFLEGRLQHLKALLGSCTVVDTPSQDGNIGMGSTIVVRDVEEGFDDEYTIVGPPESDPSEGKISYESAVGKALIGHKVGDKVEVSTHAGVFVYEVMSVK